MEQDFTQNIEQLSFGNKHQPIIVAGPCSAETHEQVLETAIKLKEIGVNIFRAGLWKPRSNPNSFEGVGSEGLNWLLEVKRTTSMLVATEVATKEHVNDALNAGIDILWIGARTTTNPFAVQEIAQALRGHQDVTIFVKNPVTPDVELWLGAIERFYNVGVRKIAAIHRGFGAYESHFYRNIPEWNVAIELKRRIPGLTMLCDPSHMGGKRELISPLSQLALDMGFEGLFIESHNNPDKALSDANQQITPEELKVLVNSLIIRRKIGSSETLEILRQQIDDCDNQLIDILKKRMEICEKIGLYKKRQDLPVVHTSRYDNVLKTRKEQASKLGLSEKFITKVMSAIHEEAVRIQLDILNNNELDQFNG